MEPREEEETKQMVPQEETEEKNEPVSYLFIALFYFLGATCFVPNNFYITANEYWMYKFRDPHQPFNKSDTQKTTLQQKFTAYTNMAGSIGMILFMFATFAISKRVSLQKRIVSSMFLLLVLFSATLIFIFLDTDSWQTGFFVIAVGTAGLFSAGTAVLLVSLFQLSARFPPRCLAAQLAGQSVCGILAASVQVIALMAAPSVKGTASLYYAIATGVIATTVIAYLAIWNQSELFQNKLEFDPNEEEEKENPGKKFEVAAIKRVLKKLALIVTSLTLCIVVTQILHPGLTALIVSNGKGTSAWSEKADAERMVSKEETKKDEPVSYLFITLFYFLGTACFVPHNFYVTANEYWMYKFRDTNQAFNQSESQKTTLQKNFTAYNGIASNTGMVLFFFVTLMIHKRISVEARILGSMTSMLVLFGITLLFIFVDTDSWQTGFFVIVIGVSVLLSFSFSVLMVSLFQLAYRFPPRCLTAQLAGQSICGILGGLVQVLALSAAPSVKGTASLYYSIAALTIAGTMIAYTVTSKKSEVFQSKLKKKWEENKGPEFDAGLMKKLLGKLALLIISLVLCMATTGILNPGLTILIESSGKGTNAWSDTYFLPVCVFLLFNSFEFIGREISNHIALLKNVYVILGTSVVRLVLLPLILLCNLQPKEHLPVVFHDDAYFIIFMILLAFSSGYILNIVIVVLPNFCDAEERSLGMIVIVLVMTIFVTLTAVLTGVVVNLI